MGCFRPYYFAAIEERYVFTCAKNKIFWFTIQLDIFLVEVRVLECFIN